VTGVQRSGAAHASGEPASPFARVLGRWDVFILSFGAMIGWGWVVLAGGWVAAGGLWGTALAFAIGGGAIILIGLLYAELASALPFVGGEHVYTERAFGPAVAFVCAWAIILGYVSVVVFEAIALPVAIGYLAPGVRQIHLWTVAGYDVNAGEAVIGAAAALIMTALNIFGARVAARAQAAVVLVLLAGGLVLILGAIFGERTLPPPEHSWGGLKGVAGVLVMVPFLFVGFDVVPQSAEEIGGSRRDIGRMIVLSVVAAVLFYILVVAATALAGPPSSGSLAAADAATTLWQSPIAGTIVVIAGIGGILTSWNAFLIGGSRAVYALAQAGQLPSFLGAVHHRFKTPWVAITLIGGLSALAPLLGRSALVWIVDAGGIGITLCYGLVAGAFLVLRKKAPDLPRPYRVAGGTVVGVAGLILAAGLLALYLPWSPSALVWPQEWLLVAGWALLGLILWFVQRSELTS
jgi:basic amino acid/polyamine antiporter, APA family